MKRLLRSLLPHEVLMVVCALALALAVVIFSSVFDEWPTVLIRMGAAIGIIFVMALLSRNQDRSRSWIQWFYAIPLITVYFKAIEHLTRQLYDFRNDQILIAADRILCGGANPTQWLLQHGPTWPALTESLMLCYFSFYLLATAVAIELFVTAHSIEKHGGDATAQWMGLDRVFFVSLYGFLLSYASYLVLPSIGPRFTLHDFLSLSKDLPGVWLTEPLRTLLNRGENIVPGMSIAEITSVVTRDAFPSGHVDITLLAIILAFKSKVKVRWPVAILGGGLIFATVYLRYHYVVDVLGGAVLAMVTLYTWEWAEGWMIALRDRVATRRR
jgi:membrane-associated phospholipid phosphatase